jgi:hypothetical protein
MSQYLFGAGVLWGTPTQDAFGNAIAAGTPVNFGALQDVSLDISFDTKMLYGSNQFPLAVGRGKGKVSGKAKAAKINGLMWNELVFGQTQSTNSGIADVFDTTGIAIPATPYQINVTTGAPTATNVQMPPTTGGLTSTDTFGKFLSIRDALNNPMTQVASGPTTGQYSVTGSQLTFAAADTATTVFIDYQYTYTVAATRVSDEPRSGTVNNVLMGYAPVFAVDLFIPYSGKQLTITLPQCISTKLGIATKLDDFTEPEFDFEGFADSLGRVIIYGTTE